MKRLKTIHFGGWLLLATALLGACAQPLLNSERIERRFGSYGVEVLNSSGLRRVSNLYSLDGERKICRTLALVIFEDPTNVAIAAEHWQITAGGSIGAVFKENGWAIHKFNLHMGSVTATREASLVAALMDIALPSELAIHIYRFQLRRGQERIDYAIITEIHHPAYLSADRLQSLYSTFPSAPLSGSSLVAIEAEARRTLLQ